MKLERGDDGFGWRSAGASNRDGRRSVPGLVRLPLQLGNDGDGQVRRSMRVETRQISNMTELAVRRPVLMRMEQRYGRCTDQKNDQNRNAP